MTTNRNLRVLPNAASPNGILLFREARCPPKECTKGAWDSFWFAASAVCVAYGERLMMISGLAPTQLYSHKCKGMSIVFNVFK